MRLLITLFWVFGILMPLSNTSFAGAGLTNNRYKVEKHKEFNQLGRKNVDERLVIKKPTSKMQLYNSLLHRLEHLKRDGAGKVFIYVYTSRDKIVASPASWIAMLEWNPPAGSDDPRITLSKQIQNLPEASTTQKNSKAKNRELAETIQSYFEHLRPMSVVNKDGHVYVQLVNPNVTSEIYKQIIGTSVCLENEFHDDKDIAGLKGVSLVNNRKDQSKTFKGGKKECDAINQVILEDRAKLLFNMQSQCMKDCWLKH